VAHVGRETRQRGKVRVPIGGILEEERVASARDIGQGVGASMANRFHSAAMSLGIPLAPSRSMTPVGRAERDDAAVCTHRGGAVVDHGSDHLTRRHRADERIGEGVRLLAATRLLALSFLASHASP
jgi:hypothetical protein